MLKNSHILTEIYFIFLKTYWTKLESLSTPNVDLSEKNQKELSSKTKLSTFRNLVGLILGETVLKVLQLPKLFKKILFERTWSGLEV